MTITMRCGHPPIDLPRGTDKIPICPQCGERRVASVSNATPKFTGTCSGPLVEKVAP